MDTQSKPKLGMKEYLSGFAPCNHTKEQVQDLILELEEIYDIVDRADYFNDSTAADHEKE